MATLGGLGHTLPYLVPGNWSNACWIATSLAGVVAPAAQHDRIEKPLILWHSGYDRNSAK
jgi:hypothetical protein